MVVLGYDLNDDVSQVSFCGADSETPSTLPVIAGTEKYVIPTVLAKRNGVNQWSVGDEAIALSESGEGVLVDSLLSKAIEGREIVVEEQVFSPVRLLELFLRRTLGLVNLIVPWQLADFIVITVEELNTKVVNMLSEVIRELPVDAAKIRFQSHTESFYYYEIHQPQELWQNQVLILEDKKEYLKTYRLMINRKTRPMVAFIEEKNYPPITDKDDKKLLHTAEELMKNQVVSSVYLIGDGFDGDWAGGTLRFLCMGRRVFLGKNLFTKGACYSALDQLCPGELQEKYVFLGKDKLKCNIGMKVIEDGRESYFPLADAGINWYDVQGEYEFLLGKEKELRFMLTPLTGKDIRWAVIRLSDFPDRPERASRIRLRIFMESECELSLKVYDLGFGGIFPPSGVTMTEKIELYEE